MSHLPKFPTEALPDKLRRWVEAESTATQTPADLAAWGALSVLSSRIARRVVVEPRPGWIEPTNIYSAVLLSPGNRKSGVFSDATRPLRKIEKELVEEAKPEVAKLKSRRRQAEGRLKKLEAALAGGDDDDARREADEIAEQLALEPEPHLPALVVDDVTPEKLAMILAEQGGRILSASPEGGVFDLMAGRYSKTNAVDIDVYLKGHAGDDHTAHRVSRDALHIERATITTFYAIQPQVIQAIVGNTAMRGRGLFARFCWAVPDSPVGHRRVGTPPVSQEIIDDYHRLVRQIGDFDGDHAVSLGNGSDKVLLDWEAEIEAMLAEGGEMEHIRDWGAKLAGTTLRLATIINAAKHGAGMPLVVSSIKAAISIARYLIPHAKYVLCEMAGTDGGLTAQEKLVRWIGVHNGEVTVRDVSRGPRPYRGKVGDSERALNELVDLGFGKWEIVHTATNVRRVFKLHNVATVSDSTNSADSGEFDTVASVAAFNGVA